MTFYDIVMLAVLLGAVFFGYWKGLAWQIASVAAVVVSYFLSVRFRDTVAAYIQAEPPLNRIAAMLVIFVACSLLIWLAYAYVNKSLEKAELDGFNRQMGALVGGVTGVLLCMVITIFSVSLLGQQAHDSIHQSKIGPYMVRGISQVSMILPGELKPYVDPHLQNFQDQIGQPTGNAPNNNGLAGGLVSFEQNPSDQNSGSFTFNPGSQPSFQGNWLNPPSTNPNGTSTNFTGTQANQGIGQLPSFEVKVDPNQLLPRAGEWLQNRLNSNNGNSVPSGTR